MERRSYNYDIKIITKEGIITYEREPLHRIGELAIRHIPYELLEAKKSKPLVFGEVSAVHKECMRKAKERNIQRIKGGKRWLY